MVVFKTATGCPPKAMCAMEQLLTNYLCGGVVSVAAWTWATGNRREAILAGLIWPYLVAVAVVAFVDGASGNERDKK